MNEIDELIANREDGEIEFKSSFGAEAVKTLCALSNSKGGKVFIGVRNNGNIVGVDIGPESIQKWINEIKTKTYPSIIPDIEQHEINGKDVVIIGIKECPFKPVSFKGRYYIRKHNSDHQMDIEEVTELYMKTIQYSWDSIPSPDCRSFEDLDQEKIDRFIKKVNEIGRFHFDGTPLESLEKIKLIRDSKPTLAADLLFSKGRPIHGIHIGRFKTPTVIIDDIMIHLPLLEAVDEVMWAIKKQISVRFEFTGEPERKEIWEYPLEALREAVINAIVHRDYRNPSDIIIKVFDDHILISNPGKLFGDITLEDLKKDNYRSSLRNVLIAESFYLIKEIEKYGSGMIRIRKELKEYPEIELELFEMGNFFNVVFKKREETVEKTREKTMEKTREKTREKILKLIREDPNITTLSLADSLGITQKGVDWQIKKLKEEGKLKRKGPDKGGHWKVVEDE
ncbi:MAG: putative DNA binding domain-containing protein [Thermoplasmatota archaeon]